MTHSVEQRKVIEDSPNSENSSFSNLVKPAADSKPSGKGDSNMSRAQMTNASVAGEVFPTSRTVLDERAPVGKEAYKFNDAIMTEDTRDGGKEQPSEDSKEVQSSDLELNLKSSSDESSLVNIEGRAPSEEGQPRVPVTSANQESVYETLPRMKFITRHSTK